MLTHFEPLKSRQPLYKGQNGFFVQRFHCTCVHVHLSNYCNQPLTEIHVHVHVCNINTCTVVNDLIIVLFYLLYTYSADGNAILMSLKLTMSSSGICSVLSEIRPILDPPSTVS